MILTTIEQFVKAIPTAKGIESYSDLQPYIESAEFWIETEILGKTLYESIVEMTESSTTQDEKLITRCRSIIANYAFYEGIPFLDLVLTNNGFAIISAKNLLPASKERVDRLRENCQSRKDSEVELLIQYLEEHDDYHDAWKGSPAYTIMTDCLIRTSSELKRYSQWTGSWRDFLQLRPKLIQETMMRLEPVFSKDYIEELIEKQRDDDPTNDDQKVIILLKYSLGSIVSGNMIAAEKIATDALRYIDSNLESFKTYTDSSEYKARIASGYVNEEESQIFSSCY
jgi:hypothetical protein